MYVCKCASQRVRKRRKRKKRGEGIYDVAANTIRQRCGGGGGRGGRGRSRGSGSAPESFCTRLLKPFGQCAAPPAPGTLLAALRRRPGRGLEGVAVGGGGAEGRSRRRRRGGGGEVRGNYYHETHAILRSRLTYELAHNSSYPNLSRASRIDSIQGHIHHSKSQLLISPRIWE